MSEELKPCPFCGTSDLLGFEPSPEGGWTVVKCRKCGASGSTGRASSEQEATAWWNRRAQPAEAEGVEVAGYRWKTAIPEANGGGYGWSYASHWSTGPKDAEELMTIADHLAALSAVTAERDRLLQEKGAPDGFVSAPLEPSLAMQNAGWHEIASQGIDPEAVEIGPIYRAMIAAMAAKEA